ncbi:hypothetical protein GCM10010919_08770 [Alishewanella longhuensis]|uniref:Uncharacterized protein n=1 Tax=Alishewanella longhuensis TaxID=1091037 RepID=A0ABQ3KV14_9ALTE|nr:hypothetical protein [Alishewanella longhuensis]GHG63249.1 hypothetical protein GCM10010919_08770 [Alishewanella longhuensis]
MRHALQSLLFCLSLTFFPVKANIILLQELTPPFSEQVVLTLTKDSFVIKSTGQKDTEIWRLNANTQTPQSWLQFSAVFGTEAINPVFFSANASNWWIAGISEEIGEESPRFVHVAHYKADGSANYVKIPAHTELGFNYNSVNRWLYLTELDTLAGVLPTRTGTNQLLMLCQNASLLQNDNCTFHLISAGELFTAGKYLLLNEQHSLKVYRPDTALTLLANYPNVSTTGTWPGATRVQMTESIVGNGTITEQKYELDLEQDVWPKALQLSRFNSNFNSQSCIFYQRDKALCKALTQLVVYSWQPEQHVSLKFEYYGPWEAVPPGELLTMLEGNKFVMATDSSIRIYEMALPTHTIKEIPEAISLFVSDDYRLNQADIFEGIETSDIEFAVLWESDSSTVSTNILIPLSATIFKIDTSKELARQNPKGLLQFSATEGLWTAYYNIPLSITNINAAPIALAPAIQLPLIEMGQTYQLTLFELFNDPDLDPLVFTQSTLPAGFTRFDNLILITPTQSGRYSFSVSATDPAGLSATVQLSGEVKTAAKTEEKKSGGSLSFSFIAMLALLLTIRQSSFTQLRRI